MKMSAYMRAWLYGEGGYYASFREIGKQGDFITSVSATPLFGGTIAKYLIDQIDAGRLSPDASVIEIGAHKGYLTADLIQFIYTLRPELLQTLSFVVVERFEALREVQRAYLRDSFGEAVAVRIVGTIEEAAAAEAFIFANEIFDAFPAALIGAEGEASVEEGRLVWGQTSPEVATLANRYGIRAGEVALEYESFATKLFAAFGRALFVTFDYGDRYARGETTMRIFAAHQLYRADEVDLRDYFGRCDITYSVNFEHLIGAFEGAGWRLDDYAMQAHALVRMGLADLLARLEASIPYEAYLRESAKAKMLIHPDYFGEKFKTLIFSKE